MPQAIGDSDRPQATSPLIRIAASLPPSLLGPDTIVGELFELFLRLSSSILYVSFVCFSLAAMHPSESDVRSILTASYSPSSVPKLEEYLMAACRGDAPYIFDAVRTLVKLYQLFPSTSSPKNIGYACLLTLLQGYCNDSSSTDLLALSYLIPVSSGVAKEEPCFTIFKCSEHLIACHFAEFWKVYASLQNSSDTVVQEMAAKFIPNIQAAILAVLALSYKEAPAAIVLTALNVDKVTAVNSLKSPVVASISQDTVVFVATADNTKRQRVYQEGVGFSAVSSLLNKIAQ